MLPMAPEKPETGGISVSDIISFLNTGHSSVLFLLFKKQMDFWFLVGHVRNLEIATRA